MDKRWSFYFAILCYLSGIIMSIYLGGWVMFLKPLRTVWAAYKAHELTTSLLCAALVKILFSSTFGGFIWCFGYLGYSSFNGYEDPDWEQIYEDRGIDRQMEILQADQECEPQISQHE